MKPFFVFNAAENSDEYNAKWGMLRALEWSNWPLFISQSVAPILLLFFYWPFVLAGTVIANVLWAAIRHRIVSIVTAQIGVNFGILKWIICPGVATYLYIHNETTTAIIALFWPVLALIIPGVPGAKIGVIQALFMKKIGYAPSDG